MTERVQRRKVKVSIEEAASQIRDDMTIAIGGFSVANHPMPIIRQIIRNGVKNLTVVGAATAGLDIDLLLGAGCVRKLVAPYVGGEAYAPIGHCFRKTVENGEVELWEASEYILYAALQAQAMGMGFFPVRCGLGSSIPQLNHDIREFKDPIHGESYLAVPAIEIDWAVIHVGIADVYGNGQHLGAAFGDRLMARAANRVMLVAERIVPNEVIRRNPYATTIPYADMVVEAPFGSHPFAAHGLYAEDADHIHEYVAATAAFRKGDGEALDAYLAKYVYGPASHDEYLNTIGISRLLKLQGAYVGRGTPVPTISL